MKYHHIQSPSIGFAFHLLGLELVLLFTKNFHFSQVNKHWLCRQLPLDMRLAYWFQVDHYISLVASLLTPASLAIMLPMVTTRMMPHQVPYFVRHNIFQLWNHNTSSLSVDYHSP